MDNKKFSKDLINKIKKDNIKQVPKIRFLIKNFFIWFFLVVSIILGALSLSITFEYLFEADWDLFHKVGLVNILTIFIPFFWIVLLVISSLFAYYEFRHTDRGYKLSLFKVFFINIISSIIIAVLLFVSGVDNYLETKLENITPKYRSMLVDDKESRMIQVWQQEDNGLLIGEILEVNDNNLTFKDTNSKGWEILLNNGYTTDVKHRVSIKVGEKIKIVGEKTSDNTFIANEIRPFMGNRK